jgi:hypothetical protein
MPWGSFLLAKADCIWSSHSIMFEHCIRWSKKTSKAAREIAHSIRMHLVKVDEGKPQAA